MLAARRTVVRLCCCWAACGREGQRWVNCKLEAGTARVLQRLVQDGIATELREEEAELAEEIRKICAALRP